MLQNTTSDYDKQDIQQQVICNSSYCSGEVTWDSNQTSVLRIESSPWWNIHQTAKIKNKTVRNLKEE
jgi:hypothetical protein